MKDWQKIILKNTSPISDAINILNKYPCVVIIDEKRQLLGTITDRDIRNRILQKKSINSSVSQLVNKNPTVINYPIKDSELLKLKNKNLYKIYPVVDSKKKLMEVFTDKEVENIIFDNLVVIMAGGLGKRLGMLTKNTPKPLLKVGNKVILETIINNFIKYNFSNFIISINYHGDKIIEYFNYGDALGAEINYIKEKTPLGTAGSLSLIEEKPKKPFFVINGDILTKVNFSKMLDFHLLNKAILTVGIREYDLKIPYGVLETEGIKIKSLVEKPANKSFINAGIYILNPCVLDYVKDVKHTNITDIINILLNQNKKVIGFPIHEYWIDIGQKNDYDQADKDFRKNFL